MKKQNASPRRWGPWVLCAALLPTAVAGHQLLHVTESHAEERRKTARERALAAMPTDATVLINIVARDMPATPDMLALGKRGTKALSRCLSDNIDADNRHKCAVTLRALGDRAALPALQTALEDWEAPVRLAVVHALGAMPDVSSVDPLIKLFKRKDEEPFTKSQVLDALGRISDQRVVRMLRAELRRKPKEGDRDFRADAFDALWHNRHLMAKTTLIGDTRSALKSKNNALVQSATWASAELRSPRLVPALILLMDHEWAGVRNRAVYALGKIGDKKATKALLAHLPNVRESRMLNNIAFALERLDKKAFYSSIKSIIEHKQAIIRLNAAFVLGDVRHAEGLPMLQKALSDSSDFVRTSAVVAVGKLGNTNASQTEAAIKALTPLTNNENLTVRAEAVYAIHQLTKGGNKDLIHDKLFTLDRRRHDAMVERAAIALAEADDPRAKEYIFTCVLQSACRTAGVEKFIAKHADDRTKGRFLLSWSRGSSALGPLVSRMKPAGTLPMARNVYDGAGYSDYMRSSLGIIANLGDTKALPIIAPRTKSKDTFTKVFALMTAARLGDAAAPGKLMEELDNLPIAWLPRFVSALSRIREKGARASLTPELLKREKGTNGDVALAAAAIRLAWDPDAAIFRLIDGLASPKSYERSLAERYLTRNRNKRVTWLLRRALAREGRDDVKDRMRVMLDDRS